MNMVNQRIANIKPSKSSVLLQHAKELMKTDPEIINLTAGEPNFDTPEVIKKEALRYVEEGYTHYVEGAGIPELREKIAKKLQEENHCQYAANGIIVTPGAKYAVYLAVRTLVNHGDEVLYLTPGWVSYPAIVETAGGIAVPVVLDYDADYELTMEALEGAVTQKTKALIVNYPTNPTGKVLSEKEREVIYAFMRKHPNVYVISDEIYEKILYDEVYHYSIAEEKELLPRIITINGFSKSAAMTGWRLGYLATTPELARMILKLFQHTISCVSGFIQKAGVVALDCKDETEAMRKAYEKRREIITTGLDAIDGVECKCPKGAFYAWVKFDLPDMDSEEIATFLIEKAKVVAIPGNAFGEGNESCVRFSFAAAEEDLIQAVKNIKQAMELYRSK